MKNIIYILFIISFFSCTVNKNSLEKKHRNYVKNVNKEISSLPIQPKKLHKREYKESNLEDDLYIMLITMTTEEKEAFKKDFVYTKSELSCTDSLLKK